MTRTTQAGARTVPRARGANKPASAENIHAYPYGTAAAGLALAGAGVVLTRPAGTCSGLRRLVQRWGGEPVVLPGLSLRGAADSAQARAALQLARRAAWVIFVSPAAVRFAWRLQPDLRFGPRTRVAAVGRATAAALGRHGVRQVLVPSASQDAVGLLALAPLQQLQGCRVALVGAPGGRELLPQSLRARGAELLRAEVYRRAPPRWTRRHLAALDCAAKPRIVLVSSAEALANIAALLPPGLALAMRNAEWVVSSARLAELARQHGYSRIHIAHSAIAADMLAAAAASLARHRL